MAFICEPCHEKDFYDALHVFNSYGVCERCKVNKTCADCHCELRPKSQVTGVHTHWCEEGDHEHTCSEAVCEITLDYDGSIITTVMICQKCMDERDALPIKTVSYVKLEPDWQTMFHYAIRIVNENIPPDQGKEIVIEMLEFGKRLEKAYNEQESEQEVGGCNTG